MKQPIYLIACCVFGIVFFPEYSAHSITVSGSNVWGWWGYNGEKNATGTSTGFIKAGKVKVTQSDDCEKFASGTYGSDEGSVVGLVAEKIYENGALFCPYQIQCNNKDREKYSYTNYYYPMCGSIQCGPSNCVTLCKSGYTGDDCSKSVSNAITKDKTNYLTKFDNIKIKTSGKGNGEREKYVMGFNQWGKDPEHDVVLGVVKYLKHGVIASPVQLDCKRENYKRAKSCVNNVAETGTKKLLCAAGYVANAAENDCITNWCDGYTENQFKETQHTEFSDGTCSKFRCTDSSKGFADTAKRECIKCDNGIAEDGTCKPEETAISEDLTNIENCGVKKCETQTAKSACKRDWLCLNDKHEIIKEYCDWPDTSSTCKQIYTAYQKCQDGYERSDSSCIIQQKDTTSETTPEPITPPLPQKSQSKYCTGFTATGFDSNIHETRTENDCIKYLCKDGMAFPKSGDYTCDICNTDAKTGIDSNGVCVKCNTGDIFDSTKGTCTATVSMDKQYLLYGSTKTNGGKKWDQNWCWTKMDSDEYEACIKNKNNDVKK